jgi:hypothetical protein
LEHLGFGLVSDLGFGIWDFPAEVWHKLCNECKKEVIMSVEWIMTAVGLAILFIGIPLVFIAVAVFTRLRTGWNAKVVWRSIRCPVRKTAVRVGFLEKDDSLLNRKTVDAIYCSALDDPSVIDCGKECLRA